MAEAHRIPDPALCDAAPAPRSRKPAAPRKAKAAAAKTPKAAAAQPAPKPASRRKPRATAQAASAPAAVMPTPSADPILPGAAALEIARIRSNVAHIRSLIDTAPAQDAHALLTRLCAEPMPPRRRAAGAEVIELLPHLRHAPEAEIEPIAADAADDAVSDLAAVVATAPTADPVTATVHAPQRSRIARLLAAWGDWLMWRLMPPTIPTPAPAPIQAAPNPAEPMPVEDMAQRLADAVAASVQPVPVEDLVSQAVARITADDALRQHLQQMIREDLEGEMGARFSGNLRAVLRREIAVTLDDRLTHL